MCGIVGYIGQKPATPTLLAALGKLEYRGYDSAGIAIVQDNRNLIVRRRVGKLGRLKALLQRKMINGNTGMGHVRWATHGEPTARNAHPHTDCTGSLALVHNGIVENYIVLKKALIARGHRFTSETDTEVIVHLIEEEVRRFPLEVAVRRTLRRLRGSSAFVVLSRMEPDRLFAARSGSPLIIGLGEGEMFFASDVPAILDRTRNVLYINDGETAVLTRDGATLFDPHGRKIARAPVRVPWDLTQAQKGGFRHYMLKEIHEQPEAAANAMLGRVDQEHHRLTLSEPVCRILRGIARDQRVTFVACGTANHAALIGGYFFEQLARISCRVEIGSEFRYRDPVVDRRTTIIAISQSGETADTLASVRLAKGRRARVLALCNVVGSTLTREADATMYIHAGPEMAVAASKSYTNQLVVLFVLTLALGKMRGVLSEKAEREFLRKLHTIPNLLTGALVEERTIARIAKKYAKARNFYFLGRGIQYPSAKEGALKLTEICPVIHAEGIAAGEMKHGPIAVIRKGWPSVFLATASPTLEKVISNMEEVKARGGDVIAIVSKGEKGIVRIADAMIEVPKTSPELAPIVSAIPLQLLAYHIARLNGCDIDQPPNLAKSVTVE